MSELRKRPRRLRLNVALTCAVVFPAMGATAAAEEPVILPVHGTLKAGHTGSIEVVPPAEATSCAATFFASGRPSRVVRFTPQGPSRRLRWKVARHVAGTWTVLVTCNRGGTKSAASSFTNTRLAVRKRGRAGGSLVRGRVRISAGVLRDLPSTTTRASLRNEPDTSDWTSCGSYWMTKAHVAGSGAATRVSFVPTKTAKLVGIAGPIWNALNRCVKFPGLTSSEVDSIYKQLFCHVTYGLLPKAGSTWDFEAWRADPSWATAMNPANECQKWGNLVGVGGEFQGRIVHSEDDPGAAYLVDNQDGIYVRRHILTTKAYWCLVNAGRPEAPSHLPQGFFDDELPEGAAVGDDVCASDTSGGGTGGTAGGGGGGTAGGSTPPTTNPTPQPPTYSETTGGAAHTWTNYANAGGLEGPTIPAYATVQIACKLTGFRVPDGNTWWYRVAQSPWNGQYYVSADASYNNGQTSGSLHGTPFFDPNVRVC